MKAVAAAGIPFRTAQRWVSLYWQFGLTALARKRRTDSRQHRNTSAKLKEAIEGIALQKPPIPVAAICRQSRRLAQDLGEEPPSYWLVYRIVAALPADLVTLAHEGTKAYSNAFELETGLHAQIGTLLGVPDRRDKDAITLLFAAVPKKRSIKVDQNNKEIEKADFQTSLPKKASPSAKYFWSARRGPLKKVRKVRASTHQFPSIV